MLVGVSVGCFKGRFRARLPRWKAAPAKRPITRTMKAHTDELRSDISLGCKETDEQGDWHWKDLHGGSQPQIFRENRAKTGPFRS